MGATASGSDRRRARSAMLGIAAHFAFLYYLFYMGTNRALVISGFPFERADALIALLAMGVALFAQSFASPQASRSLTAGSLPVCYAILMALGSSVAFIGAPSWAAMLSEGLLVGLPSGLMLCAWGRALASFEALEAGCVVFGATCLAAIACLAASLLSALFPPALSVLNFLPFAEASALIVFLRKGSDALSGTALAAAGESGHRGEVGADDAGSTRAGAASADEASTIRWSDLVASRDQRSEAARLSRRAVAGTAVFGIAAGLMETYGSDPGMAVMPTVPAALLVLAILCLGSLQFVGSAHSDPGASRSAADVDGPLTGVYRLSVLVMMAGFLFVPVLGFSGVPGEAVVLAGYLGLCALLVGLFAVMAGVAGIDPSASIARGMLSLYVGEACGLVLGNIIGALPGASLGSLAPPAVAATAGLATLISYQFLFTESDVRGLTMIVGEADRFENACASIAQSCGLSPREAEILPLALRGRTAERIASELFIAKSTVDTHLRRIYRKTGVHGRQELIDLGEQELHRLGGK